MNQGWTSAATPRPCGGSPDSTFLAALCQVYGSRLCDWHDPLRSVRAAFTMEEAIALTERAGLPDAAVTRRWPFRFLLAWERP